MSTAAEEHSSETLTELYVKALDLYNEIDTTDLASNSEEYQEMVERCRCRFEHLTVLVSQIGVFGSNESVDELPVSSIQFLCIPALLGQVTLKRKCSLATQQAMANDAKENRPQDGSRSSQQKQELPDRQTILRLAKVYFKDFLTRCKQYGITNEELPKEGLDEERTPGQASRPTPKSGKPTPQQLHAMGCEREKKVTRFREKMSLQSKVKALKQTLEQADEETKRDYYLCSVRHSILTSFDEFDSIIKESSMLEQMKARHPLQQPTAATSSARSTSSSFKPLLITRDAAQKAVFGRGYPSLPIMSVDEFYEKRVQEGWFPPGPSSSAMSGGRSSVVAEHGTASHADLTEPRPDDEQNSDDEDSEEKRARLRDRDEYRDMHRRGWGNTYNRS